MKKTKVYQALLELPSHFNLYDDLLPSHSHADMNESLANSTSGTAGLTPLTSSKRENLQGKSSSGSGTKDFSEQSKVSVCFSLMVYLQIMFVDAL